MRRALLSFFTIFSFIIVTGYVKSYPLELMVNGTPDFEQTSFVFNNTENGVLKFEASIRNNGSAPTPKGTVLGIWEKIAFFMPLSNGEGVIDESTIDFDLDSNGKKTDTFEVRWSPNVTRPWDAIIDGDHVYSLIEEDGNSINISLKGKTKLFTLGGEMSHILYFATQDYIELLFNVSLNYIPNPTIYWVLSSWNRETLEHVTVSDFYINDKPVEVNFTNNKINADNTGISADEKWYVIPNQALDFAVGEEVNLSCTLTADTTVEIDLWLIAAWSQDGMNKHLRNFSDEGLISYTFIVIQFTTDASATLSNTSSPHTPSFSFIPEIMIILLITLTLYKRKKDYDQNRSGK
ncbi:MAG: hypothetical protein ACFFB2_13325 [Promethearchaeota archaeon]